ncbi:hypothetical protein JCM10908_000664 [Rhodotorula pacifica]|uniref:Jid1p n=1 Tax=Rhodotorula pacifica TaxID=1495444 RepID=UPI00316E31B6
MMYKSVSHCTCGQALRSSSAVAPSATIPRHFASTSSRPRRIVPSTWLVQPADAAQRTARTFSNTAQARAAVLDDNNPLPFPKKANPSPFEIFHLPRDKNLSPKEVKGRYLELVKLYHPDRRAAQTERSTSTYSNSVKGKGKATDDDHEFKAIVAAYELLSDPKRRETYLRTGFGWGGSGRSGMSGGGSGGPVSPWSQSTAEYHFRRGRPMSSRTGRYSGTYDHWAWHAHATSGHYSGWSDPFNPHFRADEAGAGGGGGGGMAAGSASAGWDGQGTFGRNGAVFLALMSITLFMTPLSAWYAVPTAPPGLDPFAPGSEGKLVSELEAEKGGGSAWIPRVYDKRHQDAAANLHKARMEARVMGQEKRDALKRRVQQIRREQAFERAQEMEAIERGQAGTGHQLALPAPSLTPSTASQEP